MDLLRSTVVALGAAVATVACSSTGADAPAVRSDARMPSVLVDTEGVSHDLDGAAAAGKSVVLVFWQPWCGSCRDESAVVVRAVERFGDTLEVIGVVSGPSGSVDESEVTRARWDWGQNYPTHRDRDLTLSDAIGIESVPYVVIFGPDGEVVYRADVPPQEWME